MKNNLSNKILLIYDSLILGLLMYLPLTILVPQYPVIDKGEVLLTLFVLISLRLFTYNLTWPDINRSTTNLDLHLMNFSNTRLLVSWILVILLTIVLNSHAAHDNFSIGIPYLFSLTIYFTDAALPYLRLLQYAFVSILMLQTGLVFYNFQFEQFNLDARIAAIFRKSNLYPFLRSHSRSIVLGLLIVLVGITFVTRVYRLGDNDLYGDEFYSFNAATAVNKTGEYKLWNWLTSETYEQYYRAPIHLQLLSLAFNYFGLSVITARMVSVLASILFFVILIIFIKYFTNSWWLVLVTLGTVAFSPTYVVVSRFIRMYALLLPVFTFASLTLFKGLVYGLEQESSTKGFISVSKQIAWLVIGGALLLVAYQLQIISLILVPVFILFIMYLFIQTKKLRYLLGLILLFSLGILVWATTYNQTLSTLIGIGYYFQPEYLKTLLGYPFGWLAGGLMFFASGLYIWRLPKGLEKYKLVFLLLATVTSGIIYVFFTDRFYHPYYVLHMLIFSIPLVLMGYFRLLGQINSKQIFQLGMGLFVLVVITTFVQNLDRMYHYRSDGVFSEAYQQIIDNYNPDTDVIFGQYLRGYYLQELKKYGEPRVVDMLKNQEYSFEQFTADLNRNHSGWVTWARRKQDHLSPEILQFVTSNFQHVSGKGVDDTNVEIYYYDQTLLQEIFATPSATIDQIDHANVDIQEDL